ncbi:MAG: Mg(2+) transporter [Candelina mexicana]|nr:MAG: Mg(2+) transporter [Candelina mexicana]
MAGEEALFARPDLSRVNEVLEENGALSRNFEQAILDDDDDNKSTDESIRDIMLHGGRSRLAPTIPTLAMKGAVGRSQQDHAPRSRGPSVSARSISPPNSVDAFADPLRRGRSNTLESRVPEYDMVHHRTVSGGTFGHRPTFSFNKPNDVDGQDENFSKHDPAEDDTEQYVIDFEALEEFAAEKARLRGPVAAHLRRKHSLSSQAFKAKTARDLATKNEARDTPESTLRDISSTRNDFIVDIEDTKRRLDEKCDEILTPSQSVGQHTIEPNRYSFFSSELDTTIHASELGDLVMPGESFRDLFELGPKGGVWWLDVLNPTSDEVEALRKAFSIHPLTCEDIMTHEAREKVELFPQYYFVCFRSFVQDKDSENFLDPINVYMVVFRQGIVSFTFAQSPHAANTRKRIGKERDTGALSADWICYAMLDDMVDAFQPAIKNIEKETDMIEDHVFIAHVDDFTTLLRQIGACRKKVMTLMRLLGGKADVIRGFAKRCNAQFSVTPREEVAFFLGDVQDHVVTMMSNLGHAEKMLSRSHANYLAQLSVDSIKSGNRANEVLAKITLIATVLVPLNLICGLFGMNVPVPGRESGNLTWFFGILGVIGAIVVCSLVTARRYRFI